MQSPLCGFCISIGIEAPHDHYMRARVNGLYKTICPKLLETICQTCFKKGHTSKYCTVSTYKTNLNYKIDVKVNNKVNNKFERKNYFTNNWFLLQLESDDSLDEEEYKYMRWEDIDSDDDGLPPLPKSWKIDKKV